MAVALAALKSCYDTAKATLLYEAGFVPVYLLEDWSVSLSEFLEYSTLTRPCLTHTHTMSVRVVQSFYYKDAFIVSSRGYSTCNKNRFGQYCGLIGRECFTSVAFGSVGKQCATLSGNRNTFTHSLLFLLGASLYGRHE